MPVIQQVTSTVKAARLTHPFTTAKHTVTEMDSIYVTIQLENGLIGHGAATPNEVVTGDTLATTQTVIEHVIAPKIQGLDLANWQQLLQQVKTAIEHNTPAKAAIEIALYDLRSQWFKVPLVTLLGAQPQPVITDYTISIGSTTEMIAAAQDKVAAGFTALKIKLGTSPLSEDLHRVQQISTAVGPQIRLRLDANQAWTTKEALVAVTQLTQLGLPIDFIEQPVKADNLVGLKQVTQASLLPIMADESVHSYADALKLVTMHCCDYINIKLMKSGGLSEAEKIDQLCAANGVGCMLGCMIESQVSLAAAVAFVASHPNVKFADLDAVYMTDEQLKQPYFEMHQNKIYLNQQTGL